MKTRILFLALVLTAATGLAADKVSAINTRDQFSEFTHRYYQRPRPELVESAMKFAIKENLLDDENARAPLYATFTCLFARHPDHREAWIKSIAMLEEPARTFFQKAIEIPPMQMLAEAEVSPARNDMNWGCFFATGDERYIDNVISMLGMLDERKDLTRFLTASSAQWSLAGISKSHDKVRAELKLATASGDARIASGAREALSKPVDEIRASAEQIVRQQHEAGAW
jgi:hypothetical protein